jgi:hypothetical protein
MNTDTKVQEILSEIEQYVTERLVFYCKPNSIIVSGSFGRNEVSIQRKDGVTKFLSDLEVNPIALKYISPSKTKKIVSELKRKYDIDVSINGTKLSLMLLFPGLAQRIKPTIRSYDLKNGSKVVYGKNYLSRIPDFKPEDIPFSEGIRLIFNRIAESLNSQVSDSGSDKVIYSDCKIVIACQDAFLLSKHVYSSSYRTRNSFFQETPKEFLDRVPEFGAVARMATRYKLNGNGLENNPAYIHTKTLEICNQVLFWAITGVIGDRSIDWIEAVKLYTRYGRIGERIDTTKINIIKFIEILFFNRQHMPPLLIFRFGLPWNKLVYSTLALIYFSQPIPKEYNAAYLREARRILSLMMRLSEPATESSQEYEYLREKTLELWYAICY